MQVQMLLGLGHDLLDTCWVDAAILHQLVQRQPGDLPSHRIKAAQDDGAGRVIHDDLHSCHFFQCANVPPLSTDDAAFDLVVLDVENAHRVLHRMFRGHPLDGLDDDAFRLLVGR